MCSGALFDDYRILSAFCWPYEPVVCCDAFLEAAAFCDGNKDLGSELIINVRFCLQRTKNGQKTSEAVVYLQRAKLTPPFFVLCKPGGRGEKAARRPKKACLYVQYTLRFFRSRIDFFASRRTHANYEFRP